MYALARRLSRTMAGREPIGDHTRDNVPCCPTRASSWNQNSIGVSFSFTSSGNASSTMLLKFFLNSSCAASSFFGWNGLAVIFVRRRRRSHVPMVLGCTSRTPKRAEDCFTRSTQRHRTTPSLLRSGPFVTTSRSASACLGVSNLGLPGDVSVASPVHATLIVSFNPIAQRLTVYTRERRRSCPRPSVHHERNRLHPPGLSCVLHVRRDTPQFLCRMLIACHLHRRPHHSALDPNSTLRIGTRTRCQSAPNLSLESPSLCGLV